MDRQRNFGFLLKDLTRRYVQRFEQRASELSLTLPQCKALVRLEKNEGVSQVRLAELADVEPMAMVRILDRMEADGLLERRPDPNDRRARCLFLTPKGKALLDEIWRLSDLTRSELFAGVSRPEREAFLGILERIYASACALEDQSPVSAAARTTITPPAAAAPRARKTRSRA